MTRPTPGAPAGRRSRAREWIARYEELADDPDAFRAALEEPPPLDLLALGPGGASTLIERLARRGQRAERVAASPHHVRLAGADSAPRAAWPEAFLGRAYVQGAASAIPVLALAPRPGDRVLDLCAAPGGKTVLLHELTRSPGGGRASRIVAVDPARVRAGTLLGNLSRCAVDSTVVAVADGGSLPRSGPFDRILVDAPCSGEGTFRMPSPGFSPPERRLLEKMQGAQRRLLERGLALLAEGGRLVYATCAYSPLENEAVLDDALQRARGVELVEPDPDLPGIPGATSWQGRRFDPRVARARRLLPHHTGSWGFFYAVWERRGGPERCVEPPSEPPGDAHPATPEVRALVARYLEQAFGVAGGALDEGELLARGADVWWLARAARGVGGAGRYDLLAPGIRWVRRLGARPRATSAALRRLGERITRGVIDVDEPRLIELLRRRPLPVPDGVARGGLHAVRFDGRIVGGAFVAGGEVVLEIPASWRATAGPVRKEEEE